MLLSWDALISVFTVKWEDNYLLGAKMPAIKDGSEWLEKRPRRQIHRKDYEKARTRKVWLKRHEII